MQPENIKNLKNVIVKMFSYSCGNKENVASMARPSSLIYAYNKRLINLWWFWLLMLFAQGILRNKRLLNRFPRCWIFISHRLHRTPVGSWNHQNQDCHKICQTRTLLINLKNIWTTLCLPLRRMSKMQQRLSRVWYCSISADPMKLQRSLWETRHKWKLNALKDQSRLDEVEKVLVKNLELIYIIGKGNRFVPVLFPPKVIECMMWLISRSHSSYAFSNNVKGYIRGHAAVHNTCFRAGVNDSNVSSTKFRKLAATSVQVITLVIDSFFFLKAIISYPFLNIMIYCSACIF